MSRASASEREYANCGYHKDTAHDAPQHPAALLRRCISMSSNPRIPPAGDPFTSAPAHPSPKEKHLARLEERYRHGLMDVEERVELRECILRLRRRLGL